MKAAKACVLRKNGACLRHFVSHRDNLNVTSHSQHAQCFAHGHDWIYNDAVAVRDWPIADSSRSANSVISRCKILGVFVFVCSTPS